MQIYNWGIIGPGGIAHQFAESLTKSDNGKLYAVASRNIERAQVFANQYQAEQCYGSYEQLLADDNVQVIYIATPHSHHYPVARACLEAGKHLLMEKPLTINAHQTEQLVQLAKLHNCVFQEALWSRYMPCFATIKEWIKNGEIGELQYITSQIGFAFSDRVNHRITDPKLAGGSILDLGVYSVSLSQFLLDEHPLLIQALGQINNDGVDQNVLVNLQYPSGVFSQFTCTIGAQCSNVMTIHGKKGFISIPSHFWNGNSASITRDDIVVKQQDFPHPVNGFEYQIESTMDSIRLGRLCDPRMNHEDSIDVMHTLDEIRAQVGMQYDDPIEGLDVS